MGGAEWSLLELAAALKDKDVELNVACPEGELAYRLRRERIAVHPLPALRLPRPRPLRPATWQPWLTLPGAGRVLRRIVGAARPDIVHANSLTALLAAAPLSSSLPLVWHVRDLALQPAAARWAALRANRMIAISPAVEKRLRAILPSVTQPRIRLLENGIDCARFEKLPDKSVARARLGLPDRVPLVGMLAHLAPWKRHDLFIAGAALTARAVPEAHFMLAGSDLCGEHALYLRLLREMAARAELRGRFHWLEATDDVPLLLRALDLLLHPAVAEPFGRVICEAMAAGTPVIAVDAAGPAAIIEHNVSGCLTPPNDVAALAQATIALLGDASRRERLAAAAGARVRERFDIRRCAGDLFALYGELSSRQE